MDSRVNFTHFIIFKQTRNSIKIKMRFLLVDMTQGNKNNIFLAEKYYS